MTATAPAPAALTPGEPGALRPLPAPRPAHPGWLRSALVIGAAIGMADGTLVAIALDPIGRRFGTSLDQSQAVIAVYLVTVTALLPLAGRLGDRLGRREVYLGGFAVFAAGSLLGALAPGFGVLLVARAIQAAGGAMLTSASLALVAQWTPRERRGRSVATLVLAQAVAGLAAPPLGGALVALWGWQAVLWAGIPVAAAGAALTVAAVPRVAGSGRSAPLDLPASAGVAAILLGTGAAISGLGGDDVAGVPTAAWLGLAAGGALLLAAASFRSRVASVDLALLSGRFGAAAAATGLSTGALMSCFALLPFWIEDAHGGSAAVAGAAFLPIGVGIAVTTRRAGRLHDCGHTRALTVAGMAVAAGALTLAALAAHLDAWWLLAVALLAIGLGNGLFSSPNTSAALSAAPRGALGAAAGLLSTARNGGVVIGLGLTGAAYTALSRGGDTGRADAVATGTFLAAAAACVVVGGVAAALHRSPPVDAEPA